ncbi:hypothetical protein IWX90DRAFT_172512 [Phyllosticta citrichinensis]|uniref:F-box domain-containing protein n=1 Tax=Phyllosticta citrichinensis TaxID=1130410 RepID=A0ABR1XV30_9PEZI
MSFPTTNGSQTAEGSVQEPAMDTCGVSSPEAASPPPQSPKEKSFSLLGDLPVELVYHVIRHLPNEEKAFLSLTNTAFRDYVGELPSLNKDIAFYQKMLPEYPALMVCHDCHRFHHRDDNITHPFGNPEWVELKDPCDKQRYFRSYGVDMLFFQFQLVMDRHLLTPAHGVPLSALVTSPEHRFQRPWLPTENHHKVEVEPRIVDNEVVMKARFSLWRPDGDMAPFGTAVKTQKLGICPHMTFDDQPRRDEADEFWSEDDGFGQILDLADFDFDDFASPGLVGMVRGCPFCCTDYQTIITNRGSEGRGWLVEVLAWQCFGAAREMLDDKWLALTDEWWLEKPHPRSIAQHETGSVRDAFEGAEMQVPPEMLVCEEPDWNVVEEVVWDQVETEKIEGDWLSAEEVEEIRLGI